MATDSCLHGAGAVCTNEYFHAKFPEEIKKEFTNIAQLELLAILLAVRLWGHKFTGKIIRISCDNEACVPVVNYGHSRNHAMQKILREIVMVVGRHQFLIKLVHISGRNNELPDALSRWYISGEARRKFKRNTKNKKIDNPKI